MRFSEKDIHRFAAWSGDANPLHVDPSYARRTSFGRPVVHGVLSVIEALNEARTERAATLQRLDVEFRSAVLPDTDYLVEQRSLETGETIAVHSGASPALVAYVNGHRSSLIPDVSWASELDAHRNVTLRRTPAAMEPADLQPGVELIGVYDVQEDAAGVSCSISEDHARVLALCSYLIGMEVPGLRSLFTRLTIQFDENQTSRGPLSYRVKIVRYDPQFRILDLRLDVATAEGRALAAAELRSYVRFSPATLEVPGLVHALPHSGALTGKVALVCGGTRGLGAELTAALALSGAHVYASYSHDTEAAIELQTTLSAAGAEIRLLHGDCGDRDWCNAARTSIEAQHGQLDVLVLNACEPPSPMTLSASTVEAFGSYISRNLALVQVPAAAFVGSLQKSRGSLVAISSSFVTEQPQGFAHYVALKQAAETTVSAIGRDDAAIRTIIARPPRLQTTWNDTPTGALGTIPASTAAIRVINALAETSAVTPLLITDFPAILPKEDARGSEISIGIAATFTSEPLVPGLSFWMRELGFRADIEVAPYGQVLQTLLAPPGNTAMLVVFVRVRDWLRELAPEQRGSADFVRGHLSAVVEDLDRAIRTNRTQGVRHRVLVLCPSTAEPRDVHDAVIADVEAHLAARVGGAPGVTFVRAADWHSTYGVAEDAINDTVREHIAHIPYRQGYFHVLSTVAARHLHRAFVPARKVVVVDCDNTLWRGVVGEVGPEGLEFESCHEALHRKLLALGSAGMLVALCSKNDEADVWRVFDTRIELALRRDHIVAATINWQPKSANLKALAARLNLGLDSFVFLDDNPMECAEVRAACPGVLTLEWPTDPDLANRLLEHTWELDARSTTAEDQRRTALYKQEFLRQDLQAQTLTFRDFLDSLGLGVTVDPLSAADVKRASQLTLRTNQFNFTTRRRTEAELETLAASPSHTIRTVRVRDRFGDYGLVGLLIAEDTESELFADTFLLSCRVLGRGVEHQMLNELGRIAAARGRAAVRLRVDHTARNAPARLFLEGLACPDPQVKSEGSIEGVLAAEWAAQATFDPPAQAPAPISEDQTFGQPDADGGRLRAREAQIVRSATHLSTLDQLIAAIDGRETPRAVRKEPAGDVRTLIEQAFASALGLAPGQIREIDSLEALGCDSFKIVEITVSLLDRFPSLPPTLLFEHRSVSDIVARIEALSSATGADAPPTAATVSHRDSVADDVAVVGMQVKCAGARSPQELWNLLSEGRTAVAPVPVDRRHFFGRLEDTRPHFAGLLDDIDGFDPEVFGITPREAELMDPQLRIFLQVAWAALEDAGCLGDGFHSATGVFAGIMYGDYAHRANQVARRGESPFKSWEGFSLANRLSQIFGFQGPSLAVDTACSSSGTALHLACNALRNGDCKVAVVGGVNLILDPDRFVQLGRLGILSLSGRCLAFGADADGTVLGEGAGVVVLRPLADALQRGDRVYGVIKGTGVSTGSGTVGFTAPHPQAQAEAIRRAVVQAGIDPRTISYVESHGTGTVLGDPIEVRGLSLAYGDPSLWGGAIETTQHCSLGSIKPNIGHLEAGAGVLGLIKVLLQLQHRTLLPSITSDQPNPQIPFGSGPFAIQRQLQRWEPHSLPRRAGLNSFGVGGANAHLIIEEAPKPVDSSERAQRVSHASGAGRRAPASERVGESEGRSPSVTEERLEHILAISARTEAALNRRLELMADAFTSLQDVPIADICFSANTGRRQLDHRAAVRGSSREELVAVLKTLAADEETNAGVRGSRSRSGGRDKIAFLFTGQGSQFAGMGRDLYESHRVFRDALDRCFAQFDRELEHSLRDIMFAVADTPSAPRLNQTGYTQPALFVLGYSLAELWRSWGISPHVVIGHSVGEITAMCIAGGLSFEDAVRMIAARGRLMQALPAGGAMTSVMTTESRVLEAIAGYEDRVAIAAINGPEQVVISGDGSAVAEIAQRFGGDGIRTRELVVSHAFHSPLMHPMLADYEAVVRRIRFSEPQTEFVSCVLGRAAAAGELTDPGYWVRNVIDPVRFTDGIRAVDARGVTAFIEMGPQATLSGMGAQTLGSDAERTWLPSMRKDKAALTTVLESLGRIYSLGIDVDWRGFDSPWQRTRVTLPAYPFSNRRFWISGVATEAADAVAQPLRAARPYVIEWRPQGSPETTPRVTGEYVLVASNGDPLAEAVSRALGSAGARFTTIAAVDAATAARNGVESVLLFASSATGSDPAAESIQGVKEAAHLMRALVAPELSGRLFVVTRNAVPLERRASVTAAHGALWGLGRTFALEHPARWGALVDVDAEWNPDAAARAIVAEVLSKTAEDQVALAPDGRFVPRLVAYEQSHVARGTSHVTVVADRSYLITGGLGALGLRLARWLVDRGARRLVLVGRRTSDTSGVQGMLSDLQAKGANVTIVRADLSRADEIDTVLRLAQADAKLAGVFHAAGVDDIRPIKEVATGDIERVMGGKVRGAWLLHERTSGLPLDYFVCFSSIASVLGSSGRSAYAAANAFLDTLAHERRRLGLPALSVNWGPWSGGGMATPDALQQYERAGNRGINPEDGIAELERLLSSGGVPQAMVADIDWTSFKRGYEAQRSRPLIAELGGSTEPVEEQRVKAAAPWVERLAGVLEDSRIQQLIELLRTEVAQTLGFASPDDVHPNTPFKDMGMDSLMSADFAQRLQKRTGIRSAGLVFDHPSVEALARQLATHSAFSAAPSPAPIEPVAIAKPASHEPIVERYRPELEPEVFGFQRKAWPNRPPDLIPPRWRWMFVESAQRLGVDPQVWLHRQDGELVGHNGAIPVRVKVGASELHSAWLVDTMVLEQYRDHAVGARLMVEAHGDVPFALSLGQTEQMRAIQLKLGWVEVAPLQTAQLLVRPERVLQGKLPAPAAFAASIGLRATTGLRNAIRPTPQGIVRDVARFDETHDALWSRMSADVGCVVRRDASYLNWKYVDQPGQQFVRLELLDDRGDPQGIVVCMLREPDDVYAYRRLFIVDLVAPLASDVPEQLVGAAVRAARDQEADSVSCLHINSRLTQALRRSGFRLRQPERFLLVRPEGLEPESRCAVLKSSNWFVTQGDSDIDRPYWTTNGTEVRV